MAKLRYELRAEALRDIGILLVVFAPLDTLLRMGRTSAADWLTAIGIASFGLLFVEIGVRMETSK